MTTLLPAVRLPNRPPVPSCVRAPMHTWEVTSSLSSGMLMVPVHLGDFSVLPGTYSVAST